MSTFNALDVNLEDLAFEAEESHVVEAEESRVINVSSFDDLLGIGQAFQTKLVPVPAWSISVWVRELKQAEYTQISKKGGKLLTHDDGTSELDLSSSKGGEVLLLSFGLVTNQLGEENLVPRRSRKKISKFANAGVSPIMAAIRQISGLTSEYEEDSQTTEYRIVTDFDELQKIASNLRVKPITVHDKAKRTDIQFSIRELTLDEALKVTRQAGKIKMRKDGVSELDLSDIKNTAPLTIGMGLVESLAKEPLIKNHAQLNKLVSLRRALVAPIAEKIREFSGITTSKKNKQAEQSSEDLD